MLVVPINKVSSHIPSCLSFNLIWVWSLQDGFHMENNRAWMEMAVGVFPPSVFWSNNLQGKNYLDLLPGSTAPLAGTHREEHSTP